MIQNLGTKTTYKLLIIERTREWNGSSVSFQLHYFWGNVPNCGPCMTNINPLYFATDLTNGFMSQICHRSLFNLKLLQVPQLSKKRSESLSACICNTALMKNLRMKNLRGWRQYLEAFKFTRHWRYPVKGQWWHLGATTWPLICDCCISKTCVMKDVWDPRCKSPKTKIKTYLPWSDDCKFAFISLSENIPSWELEPF